MRAGRGKTREAPEAGALGPGRGEDPGSESKALAEGEDPEGSQEVSEQVVLNEIFVTL